jgi:hypothetical protein
MESTPLLNGSSAAASFNAEIKMQKPKQSHSRFRTVFTNAVRIVHIGFNISQPPGKVVIRSNILRFSPCPAREDCANVNSS